MICQWAEVIKVLPLWMRDEVDRQGKGHLLELRLRVNQHPEFVLLTGFKQLPGIVSELDLKYILNLASGYSPWAAASIGKGYITIPGGHRIGLCGEVVVKAGQPSTIRNVSSICIRIARDFPGIAKKLAALKGSVLIIGSPGSGKTTLLRDLVRVRSEITASSVGVIDERREIFPYTDQKYCFEIPGHVDIIHGCGKSSGIEMMVRTMGPDQVAVDELTAYEDCEALIEAAHCGVDILATAHARSITDLNVRPIYKKMLQSHIFDYVITMERDKSYSVERMQVAC